MIKWRMLGLGNVANSFTEVSKKVENAELVLIASLSKNKLNSFGKNLILWKNTLYKV